MKIWENGFFRAYNKDVTRRQVLINLMVHLENKTDRKPPCVPFSMVCTVLLHRLKSRTRIKTSSRRGDWIQAWNHLGSTLEHLHLRRSMSWEIPWQLVFQDRIALKAICLTRREMVSVRCQTPAMLILFSNFASIAMLAHESTNSTQMTQKESRSSKSFWIQLEDIIGFQMNQVIHLEHI